MGQSVNYYDATYESFASAIRKQIRRDVYGEDIGQNSWLTADELRRFAGIAGFSSTTRLLDLACGSGGPARFLAREIGLKVTGVDINEAAVATFCRTRSHARRPQQFRLRGRQQPSSLCGWLVRCRAVDRLDQSFSRPAGTAG
jgi:cyclopropane fatty-acyl-phospholipid synthase-like methyltransferase